MVGYYQFLIVPQKFKVDFEISPNSSIEHLFRERRQRVAAVCLKSFPFNSHPVFRQHQLSFRQGKSFNKRLPQNIYVSDPLKLVFCGLVFSLIVTIE